MTICSMCQSEFACDRLATAIRVIAAIPDLDERPRLKATYERVSSALAKAGWRADDQAGLCALAARGHELRDLTDLLIQEVERDRTIWQRPESGAEAGDDDV